MPADPQEIIRPAVSADIPELSRLFEEVFGAERPPELWQWKYFANPRGSASYVCESAGRLVAHCGGVPVRFHDFSRDYAALQSVDFMSSPSYPGGIGSGGVFVRTARRFFEAYCGPATVPLVYGFPGQRHRLLGEKLLGYRPVEPVGELRLEPERTDLEPEPLQPAHLRTFAALPVDFAAARDDRYLRWRYLEHPLHRYSVVSVRGPLDLRAKIAAIVRVTDEAAWLMEVGGRFSAGALRSLAAALRRIGKPVVFWCSLLHPVARLMQEAGFQAAARDHYLECRFFIQREVPRPGEMYYTLGDYDVH
jgi:hypothetical protein